jgi:hypothetical protein
MTNSDNTDKSNFTVMTNGDDPLIAFATTQSGETIDFFGIKDSKGVPIMVTQVSVYKPNDTTIYKLDDNARPVKVITQNGTEFEFNWISNQKAVLSILTQDGETQINTDIDFSSSGSVPTSRTNAISSRKNNPLKLSFKPINIENTYRIDNSERKCNIRVSSCGAPSDAEITVIVRDKSGKNLGTFPASRTSLGNYTASIPTNLAPTINLADYINPIVSALDAACTLNQVPGLPVFLCSSISAALATTGIAAPAAAAILAACENVGIGLTAYCTTLGYSGSTPAWDGSSTNKSLAEQIVNAANLNRTFKQDIEIYATANGIPFRTASKVVTTSGEGPFPNLDITLGSSTAIRKLTLNPSEPIAGADYIATTDIFCLQAGTKVKLSIVGNDDYTDSITYDITTSQGQGNFTLTVPGGDSGVLDVVTLEIILPDGTVLTRTASLVFK